MSQQCAPAAPVVNDICEAAIPLGLDPLDIVIEDNTSMAIHDYDIGHDNPCTGARSTGPDVVYRVDVSPTCVLNVVLANCAPDNWYDQSLYVVLDCQNLLAACVGSDAPCVDSVCPDEEVSWANETQQVQTLYIVLDGKFPSSAEGYVLSISTDCIVPVDATTWGSIKATYGND
jgi:hypothetical protein